MTIDLDELERTARAATRGPWRLVDGTLDPRVCNGLCGTPDPGSSHRDCDYVVHEGACLTTRDATHIAANNPAATLELIAHIRELRDLVSRGANCLELRSDRSARLEWARVLRVELAKGVHCVDPSR